MQVMRFEIQIRVKELISCKVFNEKFQRELELWIRKCMNAENSLFAGNQF